MVVNVTIRSGDEDIYTRISERLGNVGGLLRSIGSYFASSAQKTFQDQRLGPYEWEPQYPGQDDPFVNIAGLVAHLNDGGGILDKFFERAPALLDTGNLVRSITDEARSVETEGEATVTIGSRVDYASDQFFGGPKSQEVSQQAKDKISEFIESDQGDPFWFKLAFLTGEIEELETDINPRPFLGITPEAEEDLPRIVERWAKRQIEAAVEAD